MSPRYLEEEREARSEELSRHDANLERLAKAVDPALLDRYNRSNCIMRCRLQRL
jgi:hypothetical protein